MLRILVAIMLVATRVAFAAASDEFNRAAAQAAEKSKTDAYTRGSKKNLFNVYSIRKVHGKWKRVSTTIDWEPIVMR
jgi:hypothetical protein